MAEPATSGHPSERQVVGTRLRDARLDIGLTQADVADALDLGRTTVSDIENGTRRVTGLELRRFARLYQCGVAWLLGEDDSGGGVDDALRGATARLDDTDREAVLRFAQFLARRPRGGPRGGEQRG